jgi:hypothetical protein
MRRIVSLRLTGLASCLVLSTVALAGSHSPAEFPLRVHLFSHNGVSHYTHHSLDYVDGEGRANLYENGEPKAFDYSYRCQDRLMNSMGYETYMAKWKKPGRTLEVLLPVMGSPNKAETCEMKVDLKEGMAYHMHSGQMGEEPAEVFKKWMLKHQYDPEHGMNMPVASAPAPASSGAQPQ